MMKHITSSSSTLVHPESTVSVSFYYLFQQQQSWFVPWLYQRLYIVSSLVVSNFIHHAGKQFKVFHVSVFLSPAFVLVDFVLQRLKMELSSFSTA
jgi:hypothetical protein